MRKPEQFSQTCEICRDAVTSGFVKTRVHNVGWHTWSLRVEAVWRPSICDYRFLRSVARVWQEPRIATFDVDISPLTGIAAIRHPQWPGDVLCISAQCRPYHALVTRAGRSDAMATLARDLGV